MRILAAITPPEAIRKILDCLGLPSRPPPLARPVRINDLIRLRIQGVLYRVEAYKMQLLSLILSSLVGDTPGDRLRGRGVVEILRRH